MISLDRQILDRDGVVTLADRPGPTVRLTAVGDLAFHGPILEAMADRSAEYVFESVRSQLRDSDLAVGNLESILVRHPYSPLSAKACLVSGFAALDALKDAGLNVLTLANNHILDAGPEGLAECLEELRDGGFQTTGAGLDRDQARVPVTLEVRGIRFRIFAYCYDQGQIAGRSRVGCNEARLDGILGDIKKFSEADDIRVVCLHMDAEFQATPAPDRIALCRKLAEHGVQIILCHHPHVPQGIEYHRGSLIVYSLGNYIFPIIRYMSENSGDCLTSFHLEIDVDGKGPVGARIVPVYLDDVGRPIAAVGDQKHQILKLISTRTAYLDDPHAIRLRYQEMVGNFTAQLFRNLYWAVGERDWDKFRTMIRSLMISSTKRGWVRHFLAGKLRGL